MTTKFEPGPNGNCVSGNYSMNNRAKWTQAIGRSFLPPETDPTKHDFIVFNNLAGFSWGDDGVSLTLNAKNKASAAVQASHTRYVKYAKISARMTASTLPGVVTTFITMSPQKDEIDWETVGKDTKNIQSNVFYRGIEGNVGMHGGVHPVPGDIGDFHTYEIDWKHNSIAWIVDGQIVRNITKTSENAKAKNLPAGQNWFPTTPSMIQFSIWDYGSTDPNSWSGATTWGPTTSTTAKFEWINIQCYDDNDKPVERFGEAPKQSIPPSTAGGAAPTDTGELPSGTGSGNPANGVGRVSGSVVGPLAAALAVLAALAL
ncbi:hypothetical protein HK104_003859 [Borealophlyctis nickersoniae]|nr:hypothetical protein HK104_003859 [Borealophlyctis nickersoniae]